MNTLLRDVSKKIKGTTVLEKVNLALQSGMIYGLWGPNGSGKTMLLRILSGLICPTEGAALIDGKELGKELDFPPSVGLLLENPAFLDDYTGKRNLLLIAALKQKAGEKEVEESLRRVGLMPDDKRPYRKYSLGMKQRLGIAAAFMEKPDLILLDEPTNALDEDGIELLKGLLTEEKERGALIVVASHDRLFLEQMSNRVFRVSAGHLTEEQTE